jgi:hypothetical protein
MRLRSVLLPLAFLACAPEPLPLPTVEEIAALDRGAEPPLYQLLYDVPLAPEADAEVNRVRMLVWLRHMSLSPDQLEALGALRALALDRERAVATKEAELVARYSSEERQVYTELWMNLEKGVAVDAPEVVSLVERLRELRAGGARERELLALRMDGVRSILDAEAGFLRTLTPRQEQLLADAVFFLRRRLDPIANPGDFKTLVGTTYEPGQYAVLTRGLSEIPRGPLDIGALWTDDPAADAHPLHEARREVILLFALLEPGLDEALVAAKRISPPPGP